MTVRDHILEEYLGKWFLRPAQGLIGTGDGMTPNIHYVKFTGMKKMGDYGEAFTMTSVNWKMQEITYSFMHTFHELLELEYIKDKNRQAELDKLLKKSKAKQALKK